jgi:hypothetical protein
VVPLLFPNLIQYCMRHEAVTAVNIKFIVFWEATPFSFVRMYRLLGELNLFTCKFYEFSNYVLS